MQGIVTYEGSPLPRGIINFFGEDNRPRGGPIGIDGAYDCQLPPGTYRVTVSAPPVYPADWKETDPPPEDDIGLPTKYAMPNTSGLSVTIAEDPQSWDLDLE